MMYISTDYCVCVSVGHVVYLVAALAIVHATISDVPLSRSSSRTFIASMMELFATIVNDWLMVN